jgi:hypothetical protein
MMTSVPKLPLSPDEKAARSALVVIGFFVAAIVIALVVIILVAHKAIMAFFAN